MLAVAAQQPPVFVNLIIYAVVAAFIVAPAGRLPYRFVTREEYLRARERRRDCGRSGDP